MSPAKNPERRAEIEQRLLAGQSVRRIAIDLGISRQTVMFYRGSPAKAPPVRAKAIPAPKPLPAAPPRHTPAPKRKRTPLCPACCEQPATEVLIEGQVHYLRCPACMAEFDLPAPPPDPTY